MDAFGFLQCNPNAAVLRGDFLILFRHSHWYLIGTRRVPAGRMIRSMHVMSTAHAKKTLAETPSTQPSPLSDLGPDLPREVAAKILPAAEDYLPLFRAKAATLSFGFHSDMLQTAHYSVEKEKGFLSALAEMISSGEPGLSVDFPDAL